MTGYNHTQHGLMRKRAQILSEIAWLEREKIELQADLTALDQTLVLFGHDEELSTDGPRAYQRIFKRNELARMLRQIARDKPELKRNREITQEVIRVKGWDMGSEKLSNKVYRSVKEARRRQSV